MGVDPALALFRSDDSGATWTLNEALEAHPTRQQWLPGAGGLCLHTIVQDPTDPIRLYQQNHTGVYRSLDAGDTWQRIEDGLPSGFGFPMAIHPRRPRTLFVVPQESDEVRMFPGGRPGVYRTDDAGDRWVRTHVGIEEPSYSGVLRNAMTADGESEPGIYFGTTGGEVYATIDAGERWTRLLGSFPRVEALAAVTV